MKILYWIGLISNDFFHAIVAGGQNFQQADSQGLGNLSQMTEEEKDALLLAVSKKGVVPGPDGRGADVIDANDAGVLPDGAIPLKALVWLEEYLPDRASTTRQDEPLTIAEREAAEVAPVVAETPVVPVAPAQ